MKSEKIKEKSWKIINSKKFLIFIISFLSIIFIYNLLAFSFIDYFYISSVWFDNNKLTINDSLFWLGYLSIIISFGISLTGSIGTIFITQKKEKFIYFWLTALILGMVECIFSGLFYTFIADIIMMFIIIGHRNVWNSENEHTKKLTKRVFYLALSILVIYLIFWTLMNYFFIVDYFEYDLMYLDLYASAIATFAMFLLMRNNRQGFLLYGINDLMYFVLFIFVGLYALAFSYLVYLSIDTFSYSIYE